MLPPGRRECLLFSYNYRKIYKEALITGSNNQDNKPGGHITMTMTTTELLAPEVLSEIQGKIDQQVAVVRNRERHGLTSRQEETLRDALFYGLARATLEKYNRQGVHIRGITHIRTLLSIANANLEDRMQTIDTASDVDMLQVGNRQLTQAYQKEGALGMAVEQRGGWSEEDFRYGLHPTGGKYTSLKVPGLQASEGFFDNIAREEFKPEGRSLDNIMKTMPRKYAIKSQTYELDVDATIKAAGMYSHSPFYVQVRDTLVREKDNPLERDKLYRLYAQTELAALKSTAAGTVAAPEADDEL